MLDEKALRKPGFTAGTAVTLGDGREWVLPEPVVYESVPVELPGGEYELRGRKSQGPGTEDLIERLVESQVSEDWALFSRALTTLAVRCLRRNYDLSDRDLWTLLPLRPDDEANEAMWRSINDAVLGVTPAGKASAAG